MKNWRLYNLLASLSFLVGCGYRWQPEYPQAQRPTITVPFAAGDEDGCLTAEIIRALGSSGLADVLSSGGDYQLRVSVLSNSSENIGFRQDPQKIDGKEKKTLLASEGRRAMAIEAALYQEEKVVYGPYQIFADAEYDYVDGDSFRDLTFLNPAGTLVTVLPFSLGQLESIESAQEATTKPLYRQIAQKIVDAISSEW